MPTVPTFSWRWFLDWLNLDQFNVLKRWRSYHFGVGYRTGFMDGRQEGIAATMKHLKDTMDDITDEEAAKIIKEGGKNI